MTTGYALLISDKPDLIEYSVNSLFMKHTLIHYTPLFLRIQKDLSQLTDTWPKSTVKAKNKINEPHYNAFLVDLELIIPFWKMRFY